MIFGNTETQTTPENQLHRVFQYSDLAELARLRAHLLTNGEKALFKLVHQYSAGFSTISRLTGVNPSTISRRYDSILRKLISGRHVHPAASSNRLDNLICREYFHRKLTQTQIADKLNISRYRVRKAIIEVCSRNSTPPRRA